MSILNEKPAVSADGQYSTNGTYTTAVVSQNQLDIQQAFLETMGQAGIICPEPIIADGRIHRFAHKDKGNKNGWYIFFGMAGAYGDWSRDLKGKWNLRGKGLTKAERSQLASQIQASRRSQAEEIQRKNLEAAQQAQAEWGLLQENGSSAYLQRKQVNAFGIRYGDNYIAIPLRDEIGKLWSLQKIWGDGSSGKRFLPGGRKKGCFHIIGNIEDGDPIYIAEGYATGTSVHMATGKAAVIAFDARNLASVVESILKTYPNNSIIIAGDDDRWKDNNIGRDKAEATARKYGCLSVFPKFENSDTKPTDFNDLHCLEGIEQVKSQLVQPLALPSKPKLPEGFFFKKDGLYYGKDGDDNWMCDPIEVLASTRDEYHENWGIFIRFKDPDGYIHEKAIPMELLKGDCQELYGLLLSLGLRITPKKAIRNKLPEYLQKLEIPKRALCASRIGWYKEHFILPEGAIPATDTIYLQSDNSNFVGYRIAGTLAQWQEYVAKPCEGNSRLVLALSSAFAAPLLPLVHGESGGFNLIGSSSIGKSTALVVAASVWGSPKYIHTWKATSNALEAVAEAHNNTLLCLDELGQVDGHEVGEIMYMLSNGTGKNRLKAKGGLRKKYEWNLLFLSTGEVSIIDKLNEVGKTVQAGMLTRMVDIPADAEKGYGLFDMIHHFKDGNAIAQHLKSSTSRYYGNAIREYLPQLIHAKDLLPKTVTDMEKTFLSQYVKDNADGQVIRVAKRFALVAMGGELAIQYGILPYSTGDALKAAGLCFLSWLETRGSSGAQEVETAIKQIRNFIEMHQTSRFALLGDEHTHNQEQKIINQAGYKRRTVDGAYEYFFFTATFIKEVCKGLNHTIACRALKERGMLITDKDPKKFTKTHRLPTGVQKVYHLTSKILEDQESENVGVTRVTGGNKPKNVIPANDSKEGNIVTPPFMVGGNTGNIVEGLLPLVTPINLEGVTLKETPMAVLPLVTPVTHTNIEEEEEKYIREERVAILEFEAGFT